MKSEAISNSDALRPAIYATFPLCVVDKVLLMRKKNRLIVYFFQLLIS